MRGNAVGIVSLVACAVLVQCSADAPEPIPAGPAAAGTAAMQAPGARDEAVAPSPAPSPSTPAPTGPTAAEPAAAAPPVANLPTPLVFDREARLAFPPRATDPIFNFFAAGTVDVMFCPSSLPEMATGDDDGPLQCLFACASSEEQTRYALYLLDDLAGFGYWNGTDWYRIDYPLVADAWVHLTVVFDRGWLTASVDGMPIAVVRAPIGRPIDPADASRRKLEFCPMHLGSAPNGSDGFLGRIAWLRTWRAPLGVDDVARLPVLFGPPEDPVLAQCFAACSDFGDGDPQVVTASVEVRAQRAEAARGAKGAAPFATATPWLFDVDAAKARAAAEHKSILAWATRGDAYDQAVLAVERGPLADPANAALWDRYVPLLLVGDTKNRNPAGVPVGQGAILDAAGTVLRRFEHWTPEFVDGLGARLAGLAGASGAEQQARTLLLRPSASLTAADLDALAALARAGGLSEEVMLRIEHARLVAQMLALQERFRRGEPLTPEGGAPVPFGDAGWLYASEALRLFAEASLPIEPQAALCDYAVLLCEGLAEDPREDLVVDVADFVVPMRVLDAVVDAAVVAHPLPDFEADDATDPVEAATKPGDGR